MAFSNAEELATNAEQLVQLRLAGDPPEHPLILAQTSAALGRFSRFLPNVIRGTISGDGVNNKLALPASWVLRFSQLQRVELEAVGGCRRYLERDSFSLWPRPGAASHVWFSSVPASGTDNIGLDYTIPHTVDTVPSDYQETVEYLLAHTVSQLMAASYGYSVGKVVAADSVNYSAKGAEWAARADGFLKLASGHFGRDLSGEPLFGAVRQEKFSL